MADILLLLYAVELSGGTKSWLFVLLAGRCVDQVAGGFRRTVWFNHLMVGAYGLYLLASAYPHGEISWATYAGKLALLYSFNWYCSLTARTVDSVRARVRRAAIANRSKAEITGAAAHAIRTSTDGISILTELLSQTSLDNRQQHYLRSLEKHSQDIAARIGLLDASTGKNNSWSAEETLFSPGALVEEVATRLRLMAEAKGLDLRVEMGQDAPLSVRGDALKTRQVLMSITHNAIRFTDVGIVELSCRGLGPGEFVFQVKDSGPGIPEHVRTSIGQRFVRADGTLWQRSHGEQVGLGICKRLVDSMGGRLVLESEPGLGTCVRIELPMLGRSIHATEAALATRAGAQEAQASEIHR